MKNLSEQSSSTIRALNHECTLHTRKNSAELSAIWHEIDSRTLWKEWGYVSLPDCIAAESERSYPTIMEGLQNYKFFIVDQHMTWEEFLALMLEHGIKKVSLLRKREVIEGLSMQNSAKIIYLTPEMRRERIQVMAKKIAPLSVSETKLAVREAAIASGITVRQGIDMHFHNMDPADADLVERAIAHIQQRAARGSTIPTISRQQALGLWAGEYLQNFGMREIKNSA